MTQKIAVIGATALVGREILNLLAEQGVEAEITALDAKRASGVDVSFGDKDITVKPVEDFDFNGVTIAFFINNTKLSDDIVTRAATAGAVVIDLSSRHRADQDVPMVVAGVNEDRIADYGRKNIVACPSALVIGLAQTLKPLHGDAEIERVVVNALYPVSSAGKGGMDELFDQSRKFFVSDGMEATIFQKEIAFNVLPQVGVIQDDGTTSTEFTIVSELKRVLDKDIKVQATCIQMPVFIGHGASVVIECDDEITARSARRSWREAKCVTIIDEASDLEYVSPAEIAGEDGIFVSRIREDYTVDNGLAYWCVFDNIRATAAMNAVRIAQTLLKEYV